MNTDKHRSIGKAWIVFCVLFWCITAFAQEKNQRNFTWTFENQNDPILQISNESPEQIRVELRLIFEDETYRYPEDLEVPSGENRFLRIREAVDRLSRRYSNLKDFVTGSVQIQFIGDPGQLETTMLNLNPKLGVTSERGGGQRTPVVRLIEPDNGPPEGGTVVTIRGENFTDHTVVKFNDIPAMRTLQSADTLIAITPPHQKGSVDVEVSNGRNRAGLRNAFTYTAAAPVLLRLEPDSAPPAGGGSVRLRGRNFQPDTRIIWDGRPIETRYLSPDHILTTIPPGVRGSINVEVMNPDGSRFTLEDAFQYAGGPRVTGVQPQMGDTQGGYTVTVSGENFDPGCSVLFDGNYGDTTFINPHALAAVVPPGNSGPIDVSVSTEDGETDTLEGAFVYNEPPVIISINVHPNPIVRNTTTTITVEADDPEAASLDYEYRVAQGPGGSITGQGRTAVYRSPNVTGIAVIQVTVYDEHRAKAQQNLEIFVE